MTARALVPALQVAEVVRRRTRVHGWRWPRGTMAQASRALGVGEGRLLQARLDLLLEQVRSGA